MASRSPKVFISYDADVGWALPTCNISEPGRAAVRDYSADPSHRLGVRCP
jgi:hypothetical protein